MPGYRSLPRLKDLLRFDGDDPTPHFSVFAASMSRRDTRGFEPSLLFCSENDPCCPEAKCVGDPASLATHRSTRSRPLAWRVQSEIPTPPADVNELLHLAVRVVKPFADEDRGFRDAMIVRTISEHARRFEGAEVLIISRDDVFNHPDVRGQWEAVGVHPAVVKSFQLAADCLEAGLDAAVKQAIDEDIATITDFLRSRQREIFDRLLKDVEVSEAFIRGAFLQDPAYFGTLERVRQVRPIGITRVSHGHVLRGRHGREGQRGPVTFSVKVAFDITVGQIPFTQLLSSGPRVRLDAVDQPVSSQVFLTSDMPQQVSTDMTVEREIVVEAWVTEDERTGGLVGLDIEKITTW